MDKIQEVLDKFETKHHVIVNQPSGRSVFEKLKKLFLEEMQSSTVTDKQVISDEEIQAMAEKFFENHLFSENATINSNLRMKAKTNFVYGAKAIRDKLSVNKISDEEIEATAADIVFYNEEKRNWWIEGAKFIRDKLSVSKHSSAGVCGSIYYEVSEDEIQKEISDYKNNVKLEASTFTDDEIRDFCIKSLVSYKVGLQSYTNPEKQQ